MKYLMTAFLISASSAFAAAPQIDFNGLEDSECINEAGQVMVRYTELFDLGGAVKTIRFESFRNTTQGSYDQEYEASIKLDQSLYSVTFSSPFICDELKILKIKKHGVNKG